MYTIKKAEFMLCAAWTSQWPDESLPEVVMAGRSNVGKSSFINTVTNVQGLAKVSSTPGKTRTLNFFNINDELRLVDVPGYGYAKMSKQMLIKMGKMMDTYFNQREQICCVVQLVDARHGATHDDLDMIEMIQSLGIQIVIVATKVDKIPKTKRVRALKDISQQLQLPMKNIFGISSTEKTGFEPVLERINEIVEQAKK